MPVICVVLAAMTFAVFGQTLGHDFVELDDNDYVFNNPIVARGLTLKGFYWAFGFHAGNWHPLTWFSHMLDCQLYGLHPGGHHLTNVLLHAATVILLFLVLRQMTGALWRSAFVAAVFAIHPLRVESVAWVAERKDVLSGLFFVLTIGAYVRYARSPWSLPRYGLVMLLYALGLMSKPMLVTLPLILLLLDYWPLKRTESPRRLVVEKLPFQALSAAACVATLLAQRAGIQSSGSFSLVNRLGNALVACVVYLGQMVWPAGLAVLYPFPSKGLPSGEIALAAILLAGISAAAWAGWRTRPWLLFGWVWYLVMLLPVMGLIQVGGQAHADRYTYLPQIGIYVAVTWLVADWRLSRTVFGALMTGVLAVLIFCAWRQTAYWQNSETLWTRDLSCTTANDVAQNGLATALLRKGRAAEALSHYEEALRIEPLNARAQNNLAWLLATCPDASLRNGAKAVELARQANELSGGTDPSMLDTMGAAFAEAGRFKDATQTVQKAIELSRAAGRQDLVEELEGELKRYEAGLPCRQ
ncbi:MAG TPA: hypothetical protein VMR33_06350 [Candidatus Baltobacteraceae bacterium]|nr:hypothetical protein [Candidatus Baltobacteraceae bacterium]